jgi:hypothetical protein
MMVFIFSLCSMKDIDNLRLTCKHWKLLADSNELWQRLFDQDFGIHRASASSLQKKKEEVILEIDSLTEGTSLVESEEEANSLSSQSVSPMNSPRASQDIGTEEETEDKEKLEEKDQEPNKSNPNVATFFRNEDETWRGKNYTL